MVINTLFAPNQTVWFVDFVTGLPVSSTILRTEATVDNLLAITVKHLINFNNVERFIPDTQVFVSQQTLSDSFEPA
jgi:hypothetical protein